MTEDQRYADGNGVGAGGKSLSKRPDTVARKMMKDAGKLINTEKVAGHVPGIAIGDRSACQHLSQKRIRHQRNGKKKESQKKREQKER